jgi:hypothetical protein
MSRAAAFGSRIVEADLAACRTIAAAGAAEIRNSIPMAVRADPFPPPQALGNDGERWAALKAKVAKHPEPASNPEARELVDRLRGEMIALFARHGAASNQIGRAYPWLDMAEPATRRLVDALKAGLDPRRLMNPGVLGLR